MLFNSKVYLLLSILAQIYACADPAGRTSRLTDRPVVVSGTFMVPVDDHGPQSRSKSDRMA